MIGNKSLVNTFEVSNKNNPEKPILVYVQANKNYGICDIVIPNKLVAPTAPTVPTKESNKAYKEAKKQYDAAMGKYIKLRSDLLNIFQGRPLNSIEVKEHLSYMLDLLVNAAL